MSGTVTYNGRPVPEGRIEFIPVQTSSAPVSGALVADGKYRVDNKGGTPVGTHKVVITAMRTMKNKATPGGKPLLHENVLYQYIPKKYNDKTQLEITVEPGSGEITKDFNLTD